MLKFSKLSPGFCLEKGLLLAAKLHDLGKKDKRWQNACKADYDLYCHTKDKSKFKAKNLQLLGKKGIRHELIPLKELQKKLNLTDEVLVAIAAHHRKLSQKDEERFVKSGALEFWKHFKILGSKFILNKNEQTFCEVLDINYRFSGIRYLLQLADHRASASEPPNALRVPDFKAFDYEFPWKEKREVQMIAENNWESPLLLLRAPTGGGKTDASLLWAKKQIENNKADRVIICMPTRFTSNALEITIASQLSATGLYHSSAWFKKHIKQSKINKKSKQEEKQKHSFARTLEVPVTVCTIDHLLLALTQSREDHHGIFFNLAHSCVVIDEADFYDEFTQANIQVLLKVLKHFNVPVLIMSATLPESALNLYEALGHKNLSIKEDKSHNEQIRCEIKECIDFTEVNKLNPLLEKCMRQPSIIYANTVDKAVQFYRWFKKHDFKDVTLYHSRFTEPDKERKESELLGKLGKEAWERKTAHGVAILTQIGELSINISADFMLSEIAPADRLVQRFGRLSRFKKEYGIIYLLIPLKNGTLYPAPYGELIQGKWNAYRSLIETRKYFVPERKYSANDFVNIVNKIYPTQEEFSSIANENSQKLIDYLHSRWLILPSDQTKEDDEETTFWKSRNIQPTVDVIVYEVPEYFHTYEEFIEFKITSTVSLPIYLVTKGIKNHLISKKMVQVGEDKHEVLFDIKRSYCFNKGFVFEEENIKDQFL
ncbi:MAG: CRISPR-associated helicase Cas3' [Candidatus Woesearchaeota archaeon]